MANWKHTIDISAAMEMEDPRAVVQALHDELEKIVGSNEDSEDERQNIILDCKDALSLPVTDEDANLLLEWAYDWGDRDHECFINTFGD